MVTMDDLGRRVVIRAAGAFYAYVDGYVGDLAGFESGHAVVHVPSEEVATGYLRLLVPPNEVVLA